MPENEDDRLIGIRKLAKPLGFRVAKNDKINAALNGEPFVLQDPDGNPLMAARLSRIQRALHDIADGRKTN